MTGLSMSVFVMPWRDLPSLCKKKKKKYLWLRVYTYVIAEGMWLGGRVRERRSRAAREVRKCEER